MGSGIITIIIALIVFAVMIFVHEFGHFITAKIFGIKVNEFAIGMGPAVFKKRGGETLYSVRALPIGGFCAFEGETDDSSDPRAFNNAAWYKRFVVCVAGAFFNLLLGFIILIVLVSSKSTHYTPRISGFVENSYMADSVFEEGDVIKSIDNTNINIFEDIELYLAFNVKDSAPVKISAERDGKIISAEIVPSVRTLTYEYHEDYVAVTSIINGAPAEKNYVSYNAKREVYENLIGTTETTTGYLLGFEATEVPSTFKSVIHDSFYKLFYNVKLVYISLFELIRGNVGTDEISGPIGIVSVIGQSSKLGLNRLLTLVALLTVNLGIMNLLPIPALDGCKALVILVEAVIKKRLPPKKEAVINFIGFALLILLMIFATYNDIVRIFFS